MPGSPPEHLSPCFSSHAISFQRSSSCGAAAVASVLSSGSQFPPVSLKRAVTHRKHVGETSTCGLQTCWLTTNMPSQTCRRNEPLRTPNMLAYHKQARPPANAPDSPSNACHHNAISLNAAVCKKNTAYLLLGATGCLQGCSRSNTNNRGNQSHKKRGMGGCCMNSG